MSTIDERKPWKVQTHMGFERFATEDEAERRAAWLREFFTRVDPARIYVEPPAAATEGNEAND